MNTLPLAPSPNSAYANSIATFVLTLMLVLLPGSPVAASAAQRPDYKLDKKVTLGGEGGWDYFEVDPGTGHIFIPRGTHVLVVDDKGKQVADIAGTKGAHAIVFAPELKEAFLSTDGSISIVDMAALKIREEIKLQDKDPDAIVYDPSTKRVFTFNGGGTKDATAIDGVSGKVLGNVPLGGKPESAQADDQGHIFVNIEDQNRIAAFDSTTLKILHSWPVAPCENPAGLAIDVVHQRLFAGCRNGLMAVVDYNNGKVVATVPIGKGVDSNRFDAQTGLVFASCGEGVITVAHEDSPDKYTLVETIHTEKGARTMALDLKSHNVYTVTAQFGPPPPPTPERPHPYPSHIPNTFTILMFTQ
jgi:DNA-binding beta-propeller fold protein YncE